MVGRVVGTRRYLVRFGDRFKKELRSNELTDVKNRLLLRLKNIRRLVFPWKWFNGWIFTRCHRWELPVNYLFFYKISNFTLPSGESCIIIVTPNVYNILYIYSLINILYMGEPSVNSIWNYHCTFIHIFMHAYYHIYQKEIINRFFLWIILFYFLVFLICFQCYI